MKYLRSYKLLFESNNTELDIKDICLELIDDGFNVKISDTEFNPYIFPVGGKGVIISCVYGKDKPWAVFKDVALRIKDYLGEKYLYFLYRIEDSGYYQHSDLYEDIEINKNLSSIKIMYKDNEDFQRIKYSGTEKSKDLMKFNVLIGDAIEMDKNDIITVDDILEPHKNYKPGKHCRISEDDFRGWPYGRSVAQYPPIKLNMNCRSGYCWFLNDPRGDVFYRSHGVELEVLINKFKNNYYIVHIDHNTDRDNFYLIHTLEQLEKLLKERVIALYR